MKVVNHHIYFVKVSETAFSLTAGYFLAYWWSDKRITVKEGGKRGESCYQTFVEGHKPGQTILDIRLLQELWTPLMKVKLTWFAPFLTKLAGPPCQEHGQRCWTQF